MLKGDGTDGAMCGCSFDPTSLDDYCDWHRPSIKFNKRLYNKAQVYEALELVKKAITDGIISLKDVKNA